MNIDGMGTDYTYSHAAILLSQLPLQSRIARIIEPNAAWSEEAHFLSLIEYDLRVLAWQNTKDAQKGKNPPQPNKTPSEIEAEHKRAEQRTKSFDKHLIDEVLGGAEWLEQK